MYNKLFNIVLLFKVVVLKLYNRGFNNRGFNNRGFNNKSFSNRGFNNKQAFAAVYSKLLNIVLLFGIYNKLFNIFRCLVIIFCKSYAAGVLTAGAWYII